MACWLLDLKEDLPLHWQLMWKGSLYSLQMTLTFTVMVPFSSQTPARDTTECKYIYIDIYICGSWEVNILLCLPKKICLIAGIISLYYWKENQLVGFLDMTLQRKQLILCWMVWHFQMGFSYQETRPSSFSLRLPIAGKAPFCLTFLAI